MITIILFLLSIGVQFTAAIYALLLVRVTGRKTAWILISVAMVLMTWRRVVSFASLVTTGKTMVFDLPEVISLVISFLLLLGVLGIRGYFRSLTSAETDRSAGRRQPCDCLVSKRSHRNQIACACEPGRPTILK